MAFFSKRIKIALTLAFSVMQLGQGYKGIWARTYSSLAASSFPLKVEAHENGEGRIYPASLTKMMTLYLTFEALRHRKITLKTRVPNSSRAQSQPPSKVELKKKDTLSVEECIGALAVKSANNAAVMLGELLEKVYKAPIGKLMNKKAKALKMTKSHFVNPSGLFDPRQYSTAKDMAKLLYSLILHFPKYQTFLRQKKIVIKGKTYHTSNKMLHSTPSIVGGKTGYVVASGYNLALAVYQKQRLGIFVVTGSPTTKERTQRMEGMIQQFFTQPLGKRPPFFLTLPSLNDPCRWKKILPRHSAFSKAPILKRPRPTFRLTKAALPPQSRFLKRISNPVPLLKTKKINAPTPNILRRNQVSKRTAKQKAASLSKKLNLNKIPIKQTLGKIKTVQSKVA